MCLAYRMILFVIAAGLLIASSFASPLQHEPNATAIRWAGSRRSFPR